MTHRFSEMELEITSLMSHGFSLSVVFGRALSECCLNSVTRRTDTAAPPMHVKRHVRMRQLSPVRANTTTFVTFYDLDFLRLIRQVSGFS
jgi:hypothetical protein